MPRKNKQDERIGVLVRRIQETNKARKMAQGIRIAIENNAGAFCARALGYSALNENEAARKAAFGKGREFFGNLSRKKPKPVAAEQQHTAIQVSPFAGFAAQSAELELNYAMEMVRDVKELPIYEWLCGIKGLGAESGNMSGIAMLIGIVGDMRRFHDKRNRGGKYGLPALYKYLRLSVDGGKSDRIGSKTTRSCVWMIGFQLVVHNPKYKALYAARVEYELTKIDKVREVVRQEMTARKVKATPAKLEAAASARCKKMAKRWLDKKFIEHFYFAWLRSVDAGRRVSEKTNDSMRPLRSRAKRKKVAA